MLINIQALRGFAAILVLLHHALGHFKAMDLSSTGFEFIASQAYFGVDIFFVISGFVMAKTTDNKVNNFNYSFHFLKRRFIRIFFGFWPIFILSLIYYYQFNPNYLENKNIIQSFLLINTHLPNLVIFPAWSLTYELYFYIIIALMLISPAIKPKVIFIFLILTIIIKNFMIELGKNNFLDFFFSSIIIEFISGYFLFHLLKRKNNGNISIISFFMIVFLFTGLYLNIGYGYIRVLTYGVSGFLIVWLFILFEQKRIYIFNRFFKAIGDCSYTLYLTHTVLLGMFYTIGLREYLVKNNFALMGFILYILFIILFSWVFYKLIEKPLYQLSIKNL